MRPAATFTEPASPLPDHLNTSGMVDTDPSQQHPQNRVDVVRLKFSGAPFLRSWRK
jgi:hypothetical protein